MNPYCVLILSKFDEHLNRMLMNLNSTHPALKLEDIYVVDDGLTSAAKEKWKVNYVEGAKPFIYSKNFNIGIHALPENKDVFLIGDDCCFLTPQGIDKLAQIAQNDPKIGMAGPVIVGGTGNPFQHFNVLKKPVKYSDLRGNIYNNQEEFNLEVLSKFEIVNSKLYYTLPFHAVYIKRQSIDLVGPIPDSFTGCGFEDNFYSMSLIKAGLDWIIDPNVAVIHQWLKNLSSASYIKSRLNIRELAEINRKAFLEVFRE